MCIFSEIRHRAIFCLVRAYWYFVRFSSKLIQSSRSSARFHQSFVSYKIVEPFWNAAAHFIRFIHIQIHLSSDRLPAASDCRIPIFLRSNPTGHINSPNLVKIRKKSNLKAIICVSTPTKPQSKLKRWITFVWDVSNEMDTFHLWELSVKQKADTKHEVRMISCQFNQFLSAEAIFDSESINSASLFTYVVRVRLY